MALFDKLAVTSDDFAPLAPLDDAFAADGGNRAPRLTITGVPEGTAELAVICHDPDAPLPHGYTHWAVYGLPADTTAVDADSLASLGARVGPNSGGETAYYGPRPPAGHGVHHYYFWVFALSRRVEGAPSREDFLADYADAVLEQARVIGTYRQD